MAIAFLTMCTTTTSAVTTNDPQLRGNDPNAKADLTPLNQLKDAAATIGKSNNHCNSNSNPGPCPPQQSLTPVVDLSFSFVCTIFKGMRFRTAEASTTFGNGLDAKLVDSVKKDSEEFWKDVQELSPQDTAQLTREDAKDLQKVVQQVAQMDDDVTNAKRQPQVSQEYDTIRSELADVDI